MSADNNNNNDVLLSCPDNTRLLPDCQGCIPGLQLNPTTQRCEIAGAALPLRNKIATIAKQRYGKQDFHLYPYLSVPPMTDRQTAVGQWIAADKPRTILDIGPYTNPIWEYFPADGDYCPELIVAIEPCGEVTTKTSQAWQSIRRPCTGDSNAGRYTHIVVAPITAQEYMDSAHFRSTAYDAVVCVGCDGDFGPRPEHLGMLRRPVSLYIEYPKDYRPSAI